MKSPPSCLSHWLHLSLFWKPKKPIIAWLLYPANHRTASSDPSPAPSLCLTRTHPPELSPVLVWRPWKMENSPLFPCVCSSFFFVVTVNHHTVRMACLVCNWNSLGFNCWSVICLSPLDWRVLKLHKDLKIFLDRYLNTAHAFSCGGLGPSFHYMFPVPSSMRCWVVIVLSLCYWKTNEQ